MSLRAATLMLILGTAYTVLHKALHAAVPALSRSPGASAVTSALWFAATFMLIVFAYAFLRELQPRDARLRYSLIAVILFTSGLLLSKLPTWFTLDTGVVRRLAFGAAATLNSVALLVFVLALTRILSSSSSLRPPLRLLAWGLGIEIALGLAAAGYMSANLLGGAAVEPLRLLRPLAALSFLFAHGVTLWFLVRFRNISSYSELVPRRDV